MTQGKASTSGMGSTKREPIAHAVSPAAVSEIGIHQVRGTSLPLYEGRGLEAPMVGTTHYEHGSQGKHK
jgi:hypothetical protein